MPGVRFGTGLPAIQQIPARVRPWEREVGGAELLAAARAAEDAGFDWISCSDHPAVPVSRAPAMGATWYDAGSTLAFVAGVTTRIRLLSHVLVLPYRHPLVVAKQYGTLDLLSGGRLVLGVGSGHLRPEFKVLRADFEARGRTTDEYLGAIAAAWEHEVAAYEGATVAFRDVMVSPRPLQRPRPPFWVGGNSKAALRRADARRIRAAAGRSDALETVAPLSAPAGATADGVRADVERWQAAGATAFHVGIGAESVAEYLERVAWFGRDVIARVG
jgi:alkanesulfonate monooxygenase SsuD/methylene tetrahydromethanopterin reductase-like flavin-dependent oxidoreductase (luciferase family)